LPVVVLGMRDGERDVDVTSRVEEMSLEEVAIEEVMISDEEKKDRKSSR